MGDSTDVDREKLGDVLFFVFFVLLVLLVFLVFLIFLDCVGLRARFSSGMSSSESDSS
jgi:hypothetical protein